VKQEGISPLKVAAAYIGTIVGAGFATGQEILQFFARFGVMGIMGIILASALFMVFGYWIMDLGRQLNAKSHLDIIQYTGGKVFGTVTDVLITFFLFGSFTAMIAGTGALFQQQLGLPAFLGSIFMGLLTAVTVLTGVKGVINSISFVVPFLFLAVMVVSIYSLLHFPPDFSAAVNTAEGNKLISHWLTASLLYVSYNTMLSVSVLATLGVAAKDQHAIRTGAVLGGMGLGIASILIFLALCGNANRISALEVPLIYIAGGISPLAQLLYAVVLIAEVYTTAVGSLYGFISRLNPGKFKTRKEIILVLCATAAAILASQFGFSNMVKYLFPVEGICGMALLLSLLYQRLTRGSPSSADKHPK
jgi:uncharacterized membrane protein YkvI